MTGKPLVWERKQRLRPAEQNLVPKVSAFSHPAFRAVDAGIAGGGECRCYLPDFMLEAPVLLLFLVELVEELLVELVLSFLTLFLAPRVLQFFALRFSMVCDLLSESEGEGRGRLPGVYCVRRSSSLIV